MQRRGFRRGNPEVDRIHYIWEAVGRTALKRTANCHGRDRAGRPSVVHTNNPRNLVAAVARVILAAIAAVAIIMCYLVAVVPRYSAAVINANMAFADRSSAGPGIYPR